MTVVLLLCLLRWTKLGRSFYAVGGNSQSANMLGINVRRTKFLAHLLCSLLAGLSTTGLVPFASGFAMFAAGRALEQVRNSIGYPRLNVRIGAAHGGISVGEDGASRQCCEDFALMRSIPGMVVMSSADGVEAKAMVRAAYEHRGPVYMRFSRYGAPVIHDADSFTCEIGRGEVLREGTDVALIANGLPCQRIGVNDEFGHSGPAGELLKQFGLCRDCIEKAAT